MDATSAVLIAAGYVSGGVPSGWLISRASRGIDIREHGSGNPGAANVFRVVGPRAGLATLVLDAGKG
ncbi:MAG: glycerol-3-phosphate acyltransferase, partial [Elusimicrobia bacterium]|nr:glycerol-3-phosphate acyltransferase [Elusimicrobiota bacterium]